MVKKVPIITLLKKDPPNSNLTQLSCGLSGALSWRVVAEDFSSKMEVDAFFGISPDSLIVIQDNAHNDTLFLTATKSVIGWKAQQTSIRIYFHMVSVLESKM